MKEVIEHIKSNELYIPPEAEQLHSYLKELHAYGSVLLLESSSPQDEWIVLNLPLFMSTVHERLFSASPHQYKDSFLILGIIPNARLQTMFSEFSLVPLKGCLNLLQYCQEIDDSQIISKVLEISIDEAESVLFFPTLLQASREKVKWIRSHGFFCAALDGMQSVFKLMTFSRHVFFMFCFSGLHSPLRYHTHLVGLMMVTGLP